MSHPVKTLEVMKLDFETDYPGLDEISERLDNQNRKNQVDILNWKDFNYKPEVEFAIAYTGSEILLKYYVKEKWFKAEKTETNQMVCEDSCVEFFVSPVMTEYIITSSSMQSELVFWGQVPGGSK